MKYIRLVLTAVSIVVLLAACQAAPEELPAMSYDSVFPEHEPYGTGVGVMPGRVVWANNPDSVEWNGEGYWWEPENFDEDVILNMVRKSIISLGAAETVTEGWEALFEYNNKTRGKSGGYIAGEKIAIKANMNGSYSSGATKDSYTNPVLLKTLLTSLVVDAGVNDVTADRAAPVVWSEKFEGETSYLPTAVTEAEYVISLANLKGHTYGITLSAKNHFGSFINSSRISPPEAARVHQFLTNHKMDSYSVLVDLLANYQLGEKNVLYMLDALICAPSESISISGENSRWQQSPFNNDYTSSVFVSQDPVALDSVGADFLINEPTVTERNRTLKDNPMVENYLHEAGLVANAPSGAVYYNGNGRLVTNLGVHEHWNNSIEKQYSRNLGKDEGIELIYLNPQNENSQ